MDIGSRKINLESLLQMKADKKSTIQKSESLSYRDLGREMDQKEIF